MTEDLLYFPYINMQKSNWTIRTLLYYDKIYSIVPYEYFEKPDEMYDPFMHELVKQGLVTPLNPHSVIDNIPERLSPLLDELNLDKDDLQKRRNEFKKRQRINYLKFKDSNRKFHHEKINEDLFLNLVEIGVAEKGEENWFFVEQRTAAQLMTFLASELGNEIDVQPGTERVENIYFHKEVAKTSSNTIAQMTTIEQLIPRPEAISLDTLSLIKNNDKEMFIEFRKMVDDLSNIKDISEEEYRDKIEDIEKKKTDLLELFQKYEINKFFKGSFISVSISLLSELFFQIPTQNSIYSATLSTIIKPSYYFVKSQWLQKKVGKGVKFLALLDK